MVKNFHHKIIFLSYTNAVMKQVLSQQERQNNKEQLSTYFTNYSNTLISLFPTFNFFFF